jgi:hypothetical protein
MPKIYSLSKNGIIELPIEINNLIDVFLEIPKDLIVKIFQKFIIFLITYENYLIITTHENTLNNFYSNYNNISNCIDAILTLPNSIKDKYFIKFLYTFNYKDLIKLIKLFNIFEHNLLENQLGIYELYKNILSNLINNELDFIKYSNNFINNSWSNINYFNPNCFENTFEISLDKYLNKMKTNKLLKLLNKKKILNLVFEIYTFNN